MSRILEQKMLIDYCVENHILDEFFANRRMEVLRAMTIDMTFERREVLFRKEERETGRAEGRVEGIDIGDSARLISQIQKKIAKGKTLEAIADDLESTVDEIKPIYDIVSKYPPDTDPVTIYESAKRDGSF